AKAAAAVEEDGGVLLGDGVLDVALEDAATHVVGAGQVALRPLGVLADVEDDVALARLEPIEELVDRELLDARLGLVHQLEESGGVVMGHGVLYAVAAVAAGRHGSRTPPRTARV